MDASRGLLLGVVAGNICSQRVQGETIFFYKTITTWRFHDEKELKGVWNVLSILFMPTQSFLNQVLNFNFSTVNIQYSISFRCISVILRRLILDMKIIQICKIRKTKYTKRKKKKKILWIYWVFEEQIIPDARWSKKPRLRWNWFISKTGRNFLKKKWKKTGEENYLLTSDVYLPTDNNPEK